MSEKQEDNEICPRCGHMKSWVGLKRRRSNCSNCERISKESRRKRYIEEYNSVGTINGKPILPCKKCKSPKSINPYGTIYCAVCQLIRSEKYEKRNKEKVVASRTKWKEENYLHPTWNLMNSRCHLDKDKNYYNYGGRGISVYSEWRKETDLPNKENIKRYRCFSDYIVQNLGNPPTPEHTLDRINNNGNYEPGNLKWSTPKEQANNTRRSISTKLAVSDNTEIDYLGMPMTLKEMSVVTHIDLRVVKYRYVDAQRFVADDVCLYITDPFVSGRMFRYKGVDYSLPELRLISGLDKKTLRDRILKSRWPINLAVEKPVIRDHGKRGEMSNDTSPHVSSE